MNPVRLVVDRTVVSLVRAFAAHTVVQGMPVYAVASTTERDVAVRGVAAAISLMAEHDRPRWLRFVRDVPGVIVWPLPQRTAGSLNRTTRYCLLNLRTVLADRAGLATAAVLAHEGMHARLLRCGIRHTQADLPRIERVCRRAELHFLARLPEFTNKADILDRIRREMPGRPSRLSNREHR
jgi:hypothetical protein